MRAHDAHNSRARDSSLRKLTKVNRWLLAASVALTGLFAEAATHAFPGKNTAHAASTAAKHMRARSVHPHHAAPTHTKSLSPPQQLPQATTESATPEEPTAAPGTPPAEAAPAPEESTPVEEPTHEAEPAQAVEPPVISGGS
jgi:outer membrane biosynthesis protein TonB